LNHNFNASFNLQDAGGPVLRGLVMISCTGADLGYGLAGVKPFVKTLLETTNVPRAEEIPVPSDPSGHCVYNPK
jgi:hypothetical protein